MSLSWAECKSGNVHQTQMEAKSCPGCLSYMYRHDAVATQPQQRVDIDKHLNTHGRTASPSPSSSWTTVSDSDNISQDNREQSPVKSTFDQGCLEYGIQPLQSANQVGTSAGGSAFNGSSNQEFEVPTVSSLRYRRNAIYESDGSTATSHDPTAARRLSITPYQGDNGVRQPTAGSGMLPPHYNEQHFRASASETTAFLQKAVAAPSRNSTQYDASDPTTTLRASHDDLLNRLRDSTFLVERLQTRETIALAERDRALAERQRTREELNAALGGTNKTRSTSLKGRALLLLLGVAIVLGTLQYANRKLYQPEFEWMAKMRREGLGL